ncbi:hypothetical protein [Rhizobium leguminosarum]|uniref:hypothetical protein n=1 Tax=Rhizobium leguminosarum TaxID=384 RepID=UPI0015BF2895|nr:hypothetical protein [Rhizobium leguminosarum]
MSYSNNEWIQAVAKLVELTSKEQIKWSLTGDFFEGATEKIERALETLLNRKRYVVKRLQKQEWYDSDPESYHWTGPYFALDIYQVNPFKNELVASAPAIPILRDLFNKADGKYAFQSGVLDDLLKPNIFE